MNKKIVISLAVICAAAAIAVGATTAFFSDTETSTGNTFTAGSIDLKVDSQCTYNGQSSDQCGTWDLKDLVGDTRDDKGDIILGDRFFNFTDIKPGDVGENTISLHVYDNPAYACLYISPLENNDNDCTEPESADDATCGPTYDPNGGELAQNVEFFAWADDGDNVWEASELPLFSNIEGPASDVLNGKTYFLGTLPGDVTTWIGVQWCAGDMEVDLQDTTITCDGEEMGNESQSDSMSADIAFYIEQTRNNSGFTCPGNLFINQ